MRRYTGWLALLGLAALVCGFSPRAQAQSPSSPAIAAAQRDRPDLSASGELQNLNLPIASDAEQRSPGRISGRIVDQSGVPVSGARILLTHDLQSPTRELLSGDDGQFTFTNAAPGPFYLTIRSEGFAQLKVSGLLHSGEILAVPQIVLAIASVVTEVRVIPSRTEEALEEVKAEEKQRALGLVPNFYVSYVHDAAPLTSRQKFGLAWKTIADPVNFGLVGLTAGVQQSQNTFSGYGQGAQGYAKRYAAAYADGAADTFIGSAILPSLFKQDPRYFYKGTGSKRSRILYAVANSVICKGDNGRWQPNYSSVLGSLAAAGISNLYYPAKDRNGASLTFENTLIGVGAVAATNILQEFLIRKLTPNIPNNDPGGGPKSSNPIAKLWGAFIHEGD
jgi:hypothetical protein